MEKKHNYHDHAETFRKDGTPLSDLAATALDTIHSLSLIAKPGIKDEYIGRMTRKWLKVMDAKLKEIG